MKPGNSGKKDFIQVPYSGSKMADTVKVSAAQMARNNVRHTLKHRYNLKTLSLKQEFKMYTSKAYLI